MRQASNLERWDSVCILREHVDKLWVAFRDIAGVWRKICQIGTGIRAAI
jgi:hypothetical protein